MELGTCISKSLTIYYGLTPDHADLSVRLSQRVVLGTDPLASTGSKTPPIAVLRREVTVSRGPLCNPAKVRRPLVDAALERSGKSVLDKAKDAMVIDMPIMLLAAAFSPSRPLPPAKKERNS